MRTLSYFLVASACVVALAAGTKTASAQTSSQISCHEIAIVGAVKMQGRFNIQRQMRLLEALAVAGGPTERAGKIVRVIHSCKCSPCNEGAAKPNEYNLADVLRGEAQANPELAAGDLIIVPEAESIFVIENGLNSQRLVYREGMTLTQVIATLGGAARYSELVRVRIHRNPASGPSPRPLIFTLKAVLDNRNEDPVLQPRDGIEISDETGNFQLPFSVPIWDPPLIRPSDPPLFLRKSSNC